MWNITATARARSLWIAGFILPLCECGSESAGGKGAMPGTGGDRDASVQDSSTAEPSSQTGGAGGSSGVGGSGAAMGSGGLRDLGGSTGLGDAKPYDAASTTAWDTGAEKTSGCAWDAQSTCAPRGVSMLKVSANGRYFVDQDNVPFRIHGEASWDAHIVLGLADLRTYLDDRKAKGVNALFTYVSNPIAYYAGQSAPFAAELGGRGVHGALPFLKNEAGGDWDGDPTFAHYDASFASPNDAYFAWVAKFVDEAAARGMVVLMAPLYFGYGLGRADGWFRTLVNSVNTPSVCFAYGQYLAQGHGVFTGFGNKPNLIWVHGGDTMPPNGSGGALRALQVLKGLQAAGDDHIHTAHWEAGYLTTGQTDFAPFLTAYAAYSHGPYPVLGPDYAESRALYAQPVVRPTFLIETNYWGDHGASRDQIRFFHWGAALSTIAGTTSGFSPFWGFVTSPDGTTPGPVTGTTAWIPNTAYGLNQYASKGGSWYRATTGGTSGAIGPSGTGSNIEDGSITWTYVGKGSWQALLNEPGALDMQKMGALLDGVAWYDLAPSELASMPKLIVSGGGTYAAWSDRSRESGGMDFIVSAATPDGKLLLAYVPDAHKGPFEVAMTAMSKNARARWYDPVSGAFVADSAGAGFTLPNTGSHSFTVPGPNSSGASDWVLVLETS